MKTAKMQALILAIAAVMMLSALASPVTSSEASDSEMFLGEIEYEIKVIYNEGGLVNYQTTVSEGKDALIIVTPNDGYKIEIVRLDGETFNPSSVSPDGKSVLYVISNVQNSHSVEVIFKQEENSGENYRITASAGPGGSIDPDSIMNVKEGDQAVFTITPDSGYEVDKVLVDNEEVSLTDGKYTFSNVTENHSIKVTFKESGETPTPSGDSGKNNTIYYIIAAIIAILIIIAIVYFFMKKKG